MFKDKADYPAWYNTDCDLFNAYYEIASTCKLEKYGHLTDNRKDIDDYQAGKITLDQAIKAYQRQVEIWVNE